MRPAAACSGAAAATNSNGIVEDHEIGPSPAGGTFGTVRNNTLGDLDRRYNWETTAGVQHQLSPRLAVGAMLFKRQIHEIPMTDRSFITDGRLHAVRRADAGGHLEGPGRGGGARSRTR